jgi:hypothetical protein
MLFQENNLKRVPTSYLIALLQSSTEGNHNEHGVLSHHGAKGQYQTAATHIW